MLQPKEVQIRAGECGCEYEWWVRVGKWVWAWMGSRYIYIYIDI